MSINDWLSSLCLCRCLTCFCFGKDGGRMCSDGCCNIDSKKTISNKTTFYNSFYVWRFLDSNGIQTKLGCKDPNKTESICVWITTVLLNIKDKLIKVHVCVSACVCAHVRACYSALPVCLSANAEVSVFTSSKERRFYLRCATLNKNISKASPSNE